MITIVSGTNRKNSECLQFAQIVHKLVQEKGEQPSKLLSLEDIPHDWFFPDMYDADQQARSLRQLQDEYILSAQKFIFLSPEYNGSFPGALKLFIDACSVHKYSENFKDKKAALIGIATGRAGNLRGMEHLTGILNYLGTIVMPNKLPISSIASLKEETGAIADPTTLDVLASFVDDFLAF